MSMPIIKKLEESLSEKQRQWMWFVVLWLSGLLACGTLAYAIRFLMGIE